VQIRQFADGLGGLTSEAVAVPGHRQIDVAVPHDGLDGFGVNATGGQPDRKSVV
jgi:hypothetical protein